MVVRIAKVLNDARRSNMNPNYEHWETLAAFHATGSDRIYDLDALLAGKDSLTVFEDQALDYVTGGRGIVGLDIVHIQCHIGFDSVSMTRRGAHVTAVDFSPTALERVREIAGAAGVVIETVESDARSLPHTLDGRFDIAYATIGALCWIDDLARWMASAARCLREGGHLVIVELHPLIGVFAQRDPLIADFPYGGSTAVSWSGQGSYANPEADFITTTEEYCHSIGDVTTAAIEAGLVVERLVEHDAMAFDPRGDFLVRDEDGQYRFRLGVGSDGLVASAAPLPIMFTLVAKKP
jgi:SAM-dependent methyltransferase